MLIFGGLLAILYLPTLTPMPAVAAESYIFGYNNRAAVLLFLALLGAVAIYLKQNRYSLPAGDRSLTPAKPDLPGTLPFVLITTLLLCLAMWWFIRPFGGFSESSYFIDRLQLLLQERAIYKDFEFAYGPFFLYGSLWLCRALHLTPANGYYLFWSLCHLVGTMLLWRSVSEIHIDSEPLASRARSLVFLALWSFQLWQITNAGLNYTPLRVALPIFLLLRLHRMDRKLPQKSNSGIIVFAAFSLLLLLSTSPEQAIAFALTTLLYLPIRHRMEGRPFLLAEISTALLFSGELLYANRMGLFTTMRAFSSGGYNFPIFLNAYLLFFFAAALLCMAYLATGDLKERIRNSSALVILYSCAVLPAALGRCDPLHMLNNGIGIVLCALLIAWRWRRVWKSAMLAYVVLFLVVPIVSLPRYAGSLFGKAVLAHIYSNGAPAGPIAVALDKELNRLAIRRFGAEVARSKRSTLLASVSAPSSAPGRPFAESTSIVEAPFLYLPNSMGSYQGSFVDTGYFAGTLNVILPSQVQQKIEELQAYPHRDLIIPSDMDSRCQEDGPTARKILQTLFITPVLLPVRRSDETIMPFCNYIRSNYRMIHPGSPATSGYSLWRPVE